MASKNTFMVALFDKEEASAKREEMRHQEKVEKMSTFADIQRKTLEVQ
jgi:hypothetical protein